MIFNRTVLIKVTLFLSILAIAGCVTPKHNKTRFFLLDSKHEQPQKVGAYNGTITLVSVAVPHYLKRPQIVTRSNKNELELAEFHQWAEGLEENITRVLHENLSEMFPTGKVLMPQQYRIPKETLKLSINITSFERIENGKVQLKAWWVLQKDEKEKQFSIEMQSKAVAISDYSLTVATMSKLLDEFSQQIAKSIADL